MEEKLQSESINELAAALCKAQTVLAGATKDSSNPFFNSKYADLKSVWEAIREPLTKNSLSVTQTTTLFGNDIALVTTLMHSSGQWVRGFYPIRPMKPDPQATGSATTYARRYALTAIVGVFQEDDDGNAASVKPSPAAKQTRTVVNPDKMVLPIPIEELKFKSVNARTAQDLDDDVPQWDEAPPSTSENPAPQTGAVDGYIPFGRDKGKKFSEVSKADHVKLIDYWWKTLNDKNEQPKGKLADYLKKLEAWVGG